MWLLHPEKDTGVLDRLHISHAPTWNRNSVLTCTEMDSELNQVPVPVQCRTHTLIISGKEYNRMDAAGPSQLILVV